MLWMNVFKHIAYAQSAINVAFTCSWSLLRPFNGDLLHYTDLEGELDFSEEK